MRLNILAARLMRRSAINQFGVWSELLAASRPRDVILTETFVTSYKQKTIAEGRNIREKTAVKESINLVSSNSCSQAITRTNNHLTISSLIDSSNTPTLPSF